MSMTEDQGTILDSMDQTEEIYKARYDAAKAIGDEQAMSDVLNELDSLEAKHKDAYQGKGSIADALGSGALLGLGDEIAGGLGAGIGMALPESWGGLPEGTSFSDAYSGIRDQARRQQKAFELRNPKTALAAELAGGLASGGAGFGRVAAAKGLKESAKQMAKIGAAEGGVAGFGTSEEQGIGLLADTVGGAGVGAGMGAGFAPLSAGAGKAYQWVTRPKRHENIVGSIAEHNGQDLGARMREMGPDATLADAGGTAGKVHAQGLVGSDETSKARGMAEDVFTKRAAGIQSRTDDAVKEATGIDVRYLSASQEIQDRMKSQASDLYEKAYSNPGFDPLDSELMSFINDLPAVRKQLGGVLEDAQNEGLNLPYIERIVNAGEDSYITKDLMPDMRSWDRIKRRLDAIVNSHARNAHESYIPVKRARDKVRNRLDKLNPAYAKAKSVYRDDAELRDSMDEGLRFLQAPTRKVAQDVSGMSKDQRNSYAVGMVEAIREKIYASTPGEMSNFKFLENPNIHAKLNAVIQDTPKVNKLVSKLSAERQFQDTRNAVTRGSETQLRQQAAKQYGKSAGAAPSSAGDLKQGVIKGIFAKFTDMSQAQMDEVAHILFTRGNVQEVESALKRFNVKSNRAKMAIAAINKAGLIGSAAAMHQSAGQDPL